MSDSRIADQTGQMQHHLDNLGTVIDELCEITYSACSLEEPRTAVAAKPPVDTEPGSPLALMLRGFNEQVIDLKIRIANINNRLEL